MKEKVILTFDLDFWHSGEFLKNYLPKDRNSLDDFIEEPVELVLDLLDRYNQKATFFVLGQIAGKYPEIIKKIFDAGHEIASHGYSHRTLIDLGPEEFEKEIHKTNQIIEKVIGRKPIGFRAPNFSLNYQTKWALEILKKYGFRYDSSISPWFFGKNFNLSMLEIFPSPGGIYFRAFPFGFYLWLIRNISKNSPPVIYLHPYELLESAPRIKSAPWFIKKIKYIGIKNVIDKFRRVLEKFECISVKDSLIKS